MLLILLVAASLQAETATVTITASRQESLSRMQAMRRLKLQAHLVTACSDRDAWVAGGRIYQALHDRGIPTEAPELVQLMLVRGKQVTTWGRLVEAGEYSSGLFTVLQAASVVSIAGPWAVAAPALQVTLSRLKDRGARIEEALLPLQSMLLRANERVSLPAGVCESKLVMTGQVKWPVEGTITISVEMPDPPAIPSTTPKRDIADAIKEWPREREVLHTARFDIGRH